MTDRRPHKIVRLADAAPGIVQQVSYFGRDNFMGRPAAGYEAGHCWMTVEAAEALERVDRALRQNGRALKVFDAYRPMRAVADFLTWSREPDDPVSKATYYPHLEKADLFALGYLAERSSHCRGSTADLTVIDLASGTELNFGTRFDFFDPRSHTASSDIGPLAQENRAMLVDLMSAHGFENYPMEWWHFTLRGEPYPDTYFDFPVR
ncbi:MAG: M15 family metallopeptidase [Alphaproteobacteria bacterium]